MRTHDSRESSTHACPPWMEEDEGYRRIFNPCSAKGRELIRLPKSGMTRWKKATMADAPNSANPQRKGKNDQIFPRQPSDFQHSPKPRREKIGVYFYFFILWNFMIYDDVDRNFLCQGQHKDLDHMFCLHVSLFQSMVISCEVRVVYHHNYK